MENLTTAIASPNLSQAGDLFAHFNPPIIDSTVTRIFDEEFFPVAPLGLHSRQLTFNCPACASFTDLQQTQLELDVKIVLANGNALPPAVAEGATAYLSAGFENNPIGTLFRDLDIRVSGVSLSPMNNTYGYLHYLQTVLFFQKDARSSKLERQGYYDQVDPTAFSVFDATTGFGLRYDYTKESHLYQISGGIAHGLFQQPRLLPPMTPLDLNFFLADPSFAINSSVPNANMVFQIVAARLVIKRVDALDSLQQSFETRLMREPAIFPIVHSRIKTWVIPKNLASFQIPDLFGGSFLPKMCIFGLVDQSNSQGNYAASPFGFMPHNVKDLYLQVGATRLPSLSFDLSYGDTNPRCLRAFSALYGNDNYLKDCGTYIDRGR